MLKASQNLAKLKMFAETLYAGALALRATNHNALARVNALICLNIYKGLPSKTMEECAASSLVIDGIPLPDFLYYDTARSSLLRAGINLDL